jgi:hypothetical protein
LIASSLIAQSKTSWDETINGEVRVSGKARESAVPRIFGTSGHAARIIHSDQAIEARVTQQMRRR